MSRAAHGTLPQSSPESRATSLNPPVERGQETLTTMLVRVVDASMTDKAAAGAQGYDPSYWSRIKSGEKSAQLDRCERLSIGLQQAFVIAWAERIGLTCSLNDPEITAFDDLVAAAQRCQRVLQARLLVTRKAAAAKAGLR